MRIIIRIIIVTIIIIIIHRYRNRVVFFFSLRRDRYSQETGSSSSIIIVIVLSSSSLFVVTDIRKRLVESDSLPTSQSRTWKTLTSSRSRLASVMATQQASCALTTQRRTDTVRMFEFMIYLHGYSGNLLKVIHKIISSLCVRVGPFCTQAHAARTHTHTHTHAPVHAHNRALWRWQPTRRHPIMRKQVHDD
jgi:hypothetical protein